jgi:hypothetical protein
MRSFIFLISFFIYLVSALHLEVPALPRPDPVCIRDFAQQDQMVVVNLVTDGRVGDGQQLDLTITDTLGNEHRKQKNIAGKVKIAFTSQSHVAFDVCFTNKQDSSRHIKGQHLARNIELEIESGAAARDWNAVQASEKLKPVELELRRVEELTKEIDDELQYLKKREERMRDTNESTNSRVKWFSILVISALIGLGLWQIQYLRHYFKVKHII